MDKKSVGKYILVFEPKYENYQFAVYFNNDKDVTITKINKYTDIPFESKGNKPVKKNLLTDIDSKTTACSSLQQFFDKYVDPDIFKYYGDNLHKIFIAYKSDKKQRKLPCIINDEKLNRKNKLVSGSRIDDSSEITSMIDLLGEPESKFISFVEEEKNNDRARVSSNIIKLSNELRTSQHTFKYQPASSLSISIKDTRDSLRENLESYKEYREMFRLKDLYEKKLQGEKEKLQQLKQKVIHTGFIDPNVVVPLSEQLTFESNVHENREYNSKGKKS